MNEIFWTGFLVFPFAILIISLLSYILHVAIVYYFRFLLRRALDLPPPTKLNETWVLQGVVSEIMSQDMYGIHDNLYKIKDRLYKLERKRKK